MITWRKTRSKLDREFIAPALRLKVDDLLACLVENDIPPPDQVRVNDVYLVDLRWADPPTPSWRAVLSMFFGPPIAVIQVVVYTSGPTMLKTRQALRLPASDQEIVAVLKSRQVIKPHAE